MPLLHPPSLFSSIGSWHQPPFHPTLNWEYFLSILSIEITSYLYLTQPISPLRYVWFSPFLFFCRPILNFSYNYLIIFPFPWGSLKLHKWYLPSSYNIIPNHLPTHFPIYIHAWVTSNNGNMCHFPPVSPLGVPCRMVTTKLPFPKSIIPVR